MIVPLQDQDKDLARTRSEIEISFSRSVKRASDSLDSFVTDNRASRSFTLTLSEASGVSLQEGFSALPSMTYPFIVNGIPAPGVCLPLPGHGLRQAAGGNNRDIYKHPATQLHNIALAGLTLCLILSQLDRFLFVHR